MNYELSTETGRAFNCLTEYIKGPEKTAIACSGGVDSTLLLYAASAIIPGQITAFTVNSPFVPAEDIAEAAEHASALGIKHVIIDLDILAIPDIAGNSSLRCYYCKKEVFSSIIAESELMGIHTIYEGTHHDDASDYRPGTKALRELNIKSPLRECGFTKKTIHELARHLGIKEWNREPSPCFATRIPYGTEINNELIDKVRASEKILRLKGFSSVRVRIHRDIARIETDDREFEKLLDKETRYSIESDLKKLGFNYVTIDIGGYRRGSMNIGIDKERKYLG
jgi:uncharacterized protein